MLYIIIFVLDSSTMIKPIYLLIPFLLSCEASTSPDVSTDPSDASFSEEQVIDKTTLEIISPHGKVNTNDIRINFQVPSEEVKPIWDGVKKYPVPMYDVISKWTISYKDSAFGEFASSKLYKNAPLAYKFVFNRNRDSSIFVQVLAKGSGVDGSMRIQLVPK